MDKNCSFCKKEFIDLTYKHQQKYCSVECRNNFYKIRYKTFLKEKLCPICNEYYIGDAKQKYCSKVCRNQTYKHRYHPIKILECPICKKSFVKVQHYQHCCSDECKKIYYRIRTRIGDRKWYRDHIDFLKQHHKEIYLKKIQLNPNYGKEQYYKYRNRILKKNHDRYHNDIRYNLDMKLRSQFYDAFRRRNMIKNRIIGHIENLIGCSMEVFCKYFEQKLRPGMTWENFGYYGWHIDHVIPISAFDLTNIEEQKKCWHYTNLQPLWREENQQKSNRILCVITEVK